MRPRRSALSELVAVNIELLDDPPEPLRALMDEERLGELVDSIRAVGVQEPLLVERAGARFTVIAGHRRLIAARASGVTSVPCVVYPAGSVDADLVKIHENLGREDLNPADAAIAYARWLETKAGGDVDRLCEIVKQRREHVESRLLLLQGDPDVLEAIRESKISLAVARELNKIPDRGFRLSYLDAAVRGGASARLVGQWRADVAVKIAALGAAQAAVPGANPAPPAAPQDGLICFLCEDREDPHEMDLLYVHRRCRRIFLDRFVTSIRGETAK